MSKPLAIPHPKYSDLCIPCHLFIAIAEQNPVLSLCPILQAASKVSCLKGTTFLEILLASRGLRGESQPFTVVFPLATEHLACLNTHSSSILKLYFQLYTLCSFMPPCFCVYCSFYLTCSSSPQPTLPSCLPSFLNKYLWCTYYVQALFQTLNKTDEPLLSF